MFGDGLAAKELGRADGLDYGVMLERAQMLLMRAQTPLPPMAHPIP